MISKKGQVTQTAGYFALAFIFLCTLSAGVVVLRNGSSWSLLLILFSLLAALYLLLAWRKLGDTIRTANDLVEKQQQTQRESVVRLKAIYEVAAALSQVVELPELLGEGLERAVQALGLEGGQIHLKSEGQEQVMRLSAIFGDNAHLWEGEQTIELGECICGQAAVNGSPIVVVDVSKDPRLVGRACAAGGTPSVASVPLNVQGGTLGVLTVRSCNPHNFVIQDIELLTTIANFLAATLENARIRAEMRERIAELSQEVQQLAIVEERHRLGREMHDGLAQTLGLLNLQIEMVKAAAETEDWGTAEKELAQLDAFLGKAYTDVRHALSDLRRTSPKGESFIAAMQEYVQEFGRRNGIEAELRVENGSDPIRFPALVEVQLQRVIQEALTNIRRHADASRVDLRFMAMEQGWSLSVCDDGIGFDFNRLQEPEPSSFGLITMRERMQSVGGSLTVDSKPGHGTCILATIPFNPEDQN